MTSRGGPRRGRRGDGGGGAGGGPAPAAPPPRPQPEKHALGLHHPPPQPANGVVPPRRSAGAARLWGGDREAEHI
ncbi:hypothetical protein, partial [Nocardia gipuzkoensis]|uniref:hypothetical protein n=1 Tax=Nocardia gipuzkoensis TaxID=2749991 RepID=UPI003CC7FD62